MKRVEFSKDWSRTHRCGELRADHIGEEVFLTGWVNRRRDLGGLIFIDLRDRAGIVQVVCDPKENSVATDAAKELKAEFVVGVKGRVIKRAEGNINLEMHTGEIEVAAEEVVLFNEALTPPFEPRDTTNASEELRLEYRYLDLRRPSLQANLILRHVAALAVRNFLSEEGFVEVETPILTKSTPEGARDYLVPSRVNKGRFYALPQSPQLFKQLLMISGMDRYFQIAKCFRDEDLRADRQPEFTQIDIEMSFIEPDDLFELMERMLSGLFSIIGREVQMPFPVLSFQEAMDRFGSDKPDLRFSMEIADISEQVKGSAFKVFSDTIKNGGVVKAIAIEGGANLSRKQLDEAEQVVKTFGAKGLAWVKWNEDGFSGPAAKFLGEEVCDGLFRSGSCSPGSAMLMVADNWHTACTAMGALRLHFGRMLNIINQEQLKFLWVVDYPLFEQDDEGKPTPMHHPFTAPHPDDLHLLQSAPFKVRSRAYDVVLNGLEIGGGSIRIHDTAIQQQVFSVLGIGSAEAREKFGFLLDALTYGSPPHGGIAFGFDRLVMLMAGEDAIRNVIAFPKTTSGVCLMTKAPSEVDGKQLEDLGVNLNIPKGEK